MPVGARGLVARSEHHSADRSEHERGLAAVLGVRRRTHRAAVPLRGGGSGERGEAHDRGEEECRAADHRSRLAVVCSPCLAATSLAEYPPGGASVTIFGYGPGRRGEGGARGGDRAQVRPAGDPGAGRRCALGSDRSGVPRDLRRRSGGAHPPHRGAHGAHRQEGERRAPARGGGGDPRGQLRGAVAADRGPAGREGALPAGRRGPRGRAGRVRGRARRTGGGRDRVRLRRGERASSTRPPGSGAR